MQTEHWLALVGIFIGCIMLMMTALPKAYPNAKPLIWRIVFWGGLSCGLVVIGFSGLYLVYDVLLKEQPAMRVKIISILMITGGFLLMSGGVIYLIFNKKPPIPISQSIAGPTPPSSPPIQQKIEPSVTSPPTKITLSPEQKLYVDKLIQEYVKTFPKRSHETNKENLQLLEDWINDKLKKEGKGFWVHLSPPKRPVSTGIRIEDSKEVAVEGNIIKGFDIGIDIEQSEDVKMKENIINSSKQSNK
jgi:parallel beta-helix repeat protein